MNWINKVKEANRLLDNIITGANTLSSMADQANENLGVYFMRASDIQKLEVIKFYCKRIEKLAKDLKSLIGIACWDCKHRKLDDWNVTRDFCSWYPSKSERNMLKGKRCPDYEPK